MDVISCESVRVSPSIRLQLEYRTDSVKCRLGEGGGGVGNGMGVFQHVI